jgi:predicted O-methyltransferase YrrM
MTPPAPRPPFRHRAARRTFGFWQRLGLHVTPVHFYEPIPDTRELPAGLWRPRTDVPGLDLNVDAQLALLRELGRHREEFARFPRAAHPDRAAAYHVDNGSYEGGDGDALYAMLRHLKPRRMIEVGSGFSTRLAAEALLRNASDGGPPADLTAIDPHPGPAVAAGFAGLGRLIRRPVQREPLETFAALGEGDVLFIDSSHVLATGSDVQYEFLEVLPRLAGGVVVHIHDVFLPQEYPREWVVDQHRFWTEQYLLQAFLAFNDAFEVLLSLAHLHRTHPEAMESAFAAYDRRRTLPGGFWMRRRA